MSEKKIEPTEAMVEEALSQRPLTSTITIRATLRAGLNHPDARGLLPFEVVDALRAAREQGWDQAIAWGHDRKPRLINKHGTLADEWRNANPHRPAQELPTEADKIIVARDKDTDIEAVMDGETWRTREAILGRNERWFAVWRSGNRSRLFASPEDITPGTWQVDDQ